MQLFKQKTTRCSRQSGTSFTHSTLHLTTTQKGCKTQPSGDPFQKSLRATVLRRTESKEFKVQLVDEIEQLAG